MKAPGETLYNLINPQDGGIRPASWDEVAEDYHAHYARCEAAIRNAVLEECAATIDRDWKNVHPKRIAENIRALKHGD